MYIKVAVVGVGRMGRHHARIYAGLPGSDLAAVVDGDRERCATIADEFGCSACKTIEELLVKHPDVQAVSVAVPTVHHAVVAGALLEKNIACLVEKPLAPDSRQARELADLAQRKHTILQVGHTERFNPAIGAVMAMHITPRFMEINRISPMTFRSLDVGVVMDMMIHDLDIVLMFANSPLNKVDATGVAVFGEHEDIANARLVFASGCVANITASRLALKTYRRLRLFSEEAYVSLDYEARNGLMIRKSGNAQALEQVRSQIAQGTDLSNLDYSQLVNVEQLTMDKSAGDDPLTCQLSSFLGAVRQGGAPVVNAEAGCQAVEAAERVVSAIGAHQWEGL